MSVVAAPTAAAVPIYEALARAFAAEGVDMLFTLMGDGNMHWSTALMNTSGVKTIFVRHEHCACAMAMGYHSATGKVGVASVTSGPGVTQIVTALAQAARCKVPLVVFAGEVPLAARWNTQDIDQAAITIPAGAHYVAARSAQRMHDYVREAFHVARRERRPVVLGVPYDLQRQVLPDIGEYRPPKGCSELPGSIVPDPKIIDLIVGRLTEARCPVVLAGRGAVRSGAAQTIEALADRSGALLSTTLLARGMFDNNSFSIGVAGGWARNIAHELAGQADLVISFGARNASHTLDGGGFFPKAELVHVDLQPSGLSEGLLTADICIQADARLAAEAILAKCEGRHFSSTIRSDHLAHRIRTEPADAAIFDIEEGLVDPREVFGELERVVPDSFEEVAGSGHQSYFHTVMRGRAPERYHGMRDFSAIGSSISYAIGIAAVRGDGEVVLYEGDGSFLMHVQELETIRRHFLKLLLIIINDGAYGAEIHKLRADGLDDRGAVFGRPNFAEIARSFGLQGVTITDVAQIAPLFVAYQQQESATVWDVHVSDRVVTPRMRRIMQAVNPKS